VALAIFAVELPSSGTRIDHPHITSDPLKFLGSVERHAS